jgi:pSer/pThr/pTyr-binding forkhead associated (FHA) protein
VSEASEAIFEINQQAESAGRASVAVGRVDSNRISRI